MRLIFVGFKLEHFPIYGMCKQAHQVSVFFVNGMICMYVRICQKSTTKRSPCSMIVLYGAANIGIAIGI